MCPVTGPVPKEGPLIEPTSLFSAPAMLPRPSVAASPPPATNPFLSPDFGEDETFVPEDAHDPAPDTRAARSRAA
ncbi:hypothetical protein B7767_03040 [Streptomyces sp. 13-12-16]|nr:hypothetical protein B7767_03040 [Streptomyces sp. 13-12-16]